MEAGGRMTTKEREEQESLRRKSGGKDTSDPLLRAPTEKPPFTLSQIKKAIPPHCFERSILRSFSYVVRDLLIAGVLFYLAVTVFPTLPSPFHLIAWPLYWFAQGCVLGGVWVIAHECGHNAFSDYTVLDNLVGLVLHSFLLVPFFSWKYSHRRHHSNTGSVHRDEAIVPRLRSSLFWFSPFLKNPFGRVLVLAAYLTLGWPMYLSFNFFGRPYERYACHFDPYSPIYNDRERAQIFVSDACIIAVVYLLYRLAAAFSISWLLRVYGVPLLIVNASLVLVTFLQHTHPALPHYDSSEWDWLRGSLATVDRDYGFLSRVSHHIADTHVLHHLFSNMPHYHAVEATKAIRPVLGKYYRFDDTPVWKALWREARECIFVEPDQDKGKPKGVLWFSNDF